MKLKKLDAYQSFFTDGTTIYYQNYGMKQPRPIPGVDFESFKIESTYFASDKHRIYAMSSMREGLQIFDGAQRDEVIFILRGSNDTYFTDNTALYHYNGHFIKYCNPKSEKKLLQWLQKHYPDRDAYWNWGEAYYEGLQPLGENLYSDGEKVFYYFGNNTQLYDYPVYSHDVSGGSYVSPCHLPLRDAHAPSCKALNKVYSVDRDRVYFFSRSITADVASFEILGHLFAKDKNGIWYNGRLCTEIAHGDTFEVLKKPTEDSVDWAKDEYHVYAGQHGKIGKYAGYATLLRKLKGADPDTFQIIDDSWAKDHKQVYWNGTLFKKGDATTFEKITDKALTFHDWAKDKNHVYQRGTIRKGLHGGSFKILNNFWAKDDFVVYSMVTERIQKSIDVPTFRILDEEGKAEDQYCTYEIKDYTIVKHKKIPAPPLK